MRTNHSETPNHYKKKFVNMYILIAITTVTLSNISAQNVNTFTIGPIEAEQGEKATGSLIVQKGIDDGTFIPITVINGEKPGPVLTLVAGVHGTEYVPIITAQQLVKEIKPTQLSGTLVIVHIANIPAFSGRSAYSNPIDHKNLNRIFPGKKDGTISERIAYTLTHEIISKSDYYIDMHGGEFNERLIDFLYFYYGDSQSNACKKSIQMAHAMGNNYLIPFKYNTVPDSLPSEYSDLEAFRRGVGSIVLEWGDRGIVSMREVELAKNGIYNVMRTIEMINGKAIKYEHPVYLTNEKDINSNVDGILYVRLDRGQTISKGTLIGYTTDYWGNTLEEYRSPINGIVVALKVAPSINKGEIVCRVAEVWDNFEE